MSTVSAVSRTVAVISASVPFSRSPLIGVFNAGAYGYSMSPQLFLSHPTPTEVIIHEGEIVTARRRGRHEDLLLNQEPFPGTA